MPDEIEFPRDISEPEIVSFFEYIQSRLGKNGACDITFAGTMQIRREGLRNKTLSDINGMVYLEKDEILVPVGFSLTHRGRGKFSGLSLNEYGLHVDKRRRDIDMVHTSLKDRISEYFVNNPYSVKTK